MLRFRGFRASLTFTSETISNIDHYDKSPGVSLIGAYRSNNEFIGNFTYPEPHKRITPSMVKLPNLQSEPSIKPSKSTNDLIRPQTETANIRNSSSDLLQTNNNNVQLTKSQIKEQNNLEKRRLAEQQKQEKLAALEQKKRDKLAALEQKKRDKLAAQEQLKRDKQAAQEQQKRDKLAAQEQQKRDKLAAQEQRKRDKLAAQEQQKQEKLRKETERQAQQTGVEKDKSKVIKRAAPPLPPNPPVPANPQPQGLAAYSTNTLESSISRSSGPPPYSAMSEVIPNEGDDTGNTSFAKPVNDSGSWDMISQHRKQLNRPTGVGKNVTKQTHLNLHYNVAPSKVNQDNSEA